VVTLGGEEFRAAEKVPLMALMQFAHIGDKAARGDATEFEQWAVLYTLCESVIHADDWGRFQAAALREHADDKALMLIVRQVLRGETGRPTRRPSDSSDGPGSTPESSEPDSSSPEEEEPEPRPDLHTRVVRRLEAEGRPDKALMVLMAQERQRAISAA
jgi:hypothetical protein